MTDFQHSVSVAVTIAVAVAVSVKTVSVQCRCCWGVCAAIAPQALEAGRRVSRAKEWSELQAGTNGRYGKIELDPIWTDQRQRRTYGNGERYFLRKLRSFYGILTDERNSYVLLQRTTAIRERRNGYVKMETRRITHHGTSHDKWHCALLHRLLPNTLYLYIL